MNRVEYPYSFLTQTLLLGLHNSLQTCFLCVSSHSGCKNQTVYRCSLQGCITQGSVGLYKKIFIKLRRSKTKDENPRYHRQGYLRRHHIPCVVLGSLQEPVQSSGVCNLHSWLYSSAGWEWHRNTAHTGELHKSGAWRESQHKKPV